MLSSVPVNFRVAVCPASAASEELRRAWPEIASIFEKWPGQSARTHRSAAPGVCPTPSVDGQVEGADGFLVPRVHHAPPGVRVTAAAQPTQINDTRRTQPLPLTVTSVVVTLTGWLRLHRTTIEDKCLMRHSLTAGASPAASYRIGRLLEA